MVNMVVRIVVRHMVSDIVNRGSDILASQPIARPRYAHGSHRRRRVWVRVVALLCTDRSKVNKP